MAGDNKLKVLTTTAQIGDMVSSVGGERVDTLVLIQGELDPHSYELVKGDGEKFERADLIFYNGLGLEHGASLSAILENSSKTVSLGQKIEQTSPHQILKKGRVTDPHIWMDISLWEKTVDPIVDALSRLDPPGASYYREQGARLSGKMREAHQTIFALMQEVPAEKRYLVTSHDAFNYFARAYLAVPGEVDWSDRFAAPEGLSPEGQLSPMDLQKIIDFARERKISVIFPESNVSQDSIKKIAIAGKELGLNIRICRKPLFGDSMSGRPYLEMMNQNASTIAEGLDDE